MVSFRASAVKEIIALHFFSLLLINDWYSQYLCCWEWMCGWMCEQDEEGMLQDANSQTSPSAWLDNSELNTSAEYVDS